ncbi:ATP-binding protein [Lyngbya confervoides]|uniref:ATP-binding protein n=1 Tax=Lyngbya confervoides BDU141951 TaxID=1574623 RepID=A0ABD4T276_9CYAN|nr:ATP-binding protein [Lyngbya confervoides]MCM1982694.1 ATP-binding protein [Lyngbya confervoides BDU141951]
MIALSLRPSQRRWQTITFPSTLYLFPILDLLLQEVPSHLYWDMRLGLQEALVNAAKHGNSLDPSKLIEVKFAKQRQTYVWMIADQGQGFCPPVSCHWPAQPSPCPEHRQECGRGIFILFQVFDEVAWFNEGKELRLTKYLTD